jgi:putative endonuclease
MYYTYILISKTSGRLYIGQTNNIEDRLHRHNSGQSPATKGKGPWDLLFSKSFATRVEAVQLELKLKSFKNHQYIISWIENNNK